MFIPVPVITKQSLSYMRKNWKLGFHLIIRTKRFGVNNQWWWHDGSLFGLPLYKIIWRIVTIKQLITDLQMVWFRARACKFMTAEELHTIGWDKEINNG